MILDDVLQIIQKFSTLGMKQPHAESRLINDLGFDSVRLMELMFALEDHFDVTFLDEHLDIQYFQTPSDIAKLIEGIK
jgi:acyl carrier protein